MTSALEGVTILDLSRDVAGAYAAMLMAEQGADCIKLPMAGEASRYPAGFTLFDRSKRAMTLNLEMVGAREILHHLVKKADIIIKDYSPAQARRLHLTYATLAKINPRIIDCSVTPFGEKGPLKDKPANEGVAAAFSGTMGGQGGLRYPPIFVFIPFGSYAAGILTAYGASLALLVREATGKGQKVDTSLLAGSLAMEAGAFISASSITPVVARRSIQQGVLPAYKLYQCQDDWIMVACGNPTFWNKLCMALERIDLLADPRFEGMPWALKSLESRDILVDILTDTFRAKPRAHWLSLLSANDVPCAPVITRAEFMDDPQVQRNEMVVEIEDSYFGKMRQMGIPLTLTDYPGKIKSRAPKPGEHTRAILKELGYQARQMADFKKRGII